MGSLTALFQQGGFVQQHAGSITSALSAVSDLTGGIMAQRQAAANVKLLKRQGRQAEAQMRREAKKAKGAATARFAKAGVDPGEGTALGVALEAEEQLMLEGRRRRMGFEAEADIEKQKGTVALMQGLFGAGTTLLGATRQPDDPKRFRATLQPRGVDIAARMKRLDF